jgi:hypothetical protein
LTILIKIFKVYLKQSHFKKQYIFIKKIAKSEHKPPPRSLEKWDLRSYPTVHLYECFICQQFTYMNVLYADYIVRKVKFKYGYRYSDGYRLYYSQSKI